MQDTIKQKVVRVEIGPDNYVEVHRMRWKAMRSFIKSLGALMAKAYGSAPKEGGPGVISLLLSRLPEVIEASEGLTVILIEGSTELAAAQFDDLEAIAAAKILKAVIDLNMDDETKNSFAGVGDSLRALMPAAESPPTTKTG
jgi:hypothetical protein